MRRLKDLGPLADHRNRGVKPAAQADFMYAATRHEPTSTASLLVLKDTASGWANEMLVPKGQNSAAILFVRTF